MTPTSMPAAFHGFLAPYPLRRLTAEESRAFLALSTLDDATEEAQKHLEQIKRVYSGFLPFNVLCSRLQSYQIPVTIAVHVFAFWSCRNAGQSVVMAWTLAAIRSELKLAQPLCLLDLVSHSFSAGLPDTMNEKAWNNCWDAQKYNGQNLIDILPWPGVPAPC